MVKLMNCKQWSSKEDQILKDYVENHGARKWDAIGVDSGLNRTGKSCRLRWLNHLKPGVKKGSFSSHEQALVLQMHSKFGNKWSKMAKQLPGRSDNDIKNFWHTNAKRSAEKEAEQRDRTEKQETEQRDRGAGQEAGSLSPISFDVDYDPELLDAIEVGTQKFPSVQFDQQRDINAGQEAVQSDGSLPPISFNIDYDPELWDAIEVGTQEFPSVQSDQQRDGSAGQEAVESDGSLSPDSFDVPWWMLY